jgi:protein tyrosine/serine phosphatase
MKATFILIAAVLFPMALYAQAADAKRPELWAKPIEMAGAPNLHQVDKTLYRCAQPTAEGMRNIKAAGIVTVINLRAFHSDKDELGDTGLGSEHIDMKTWHPEHEDVVRFLKIVSDPKRAPVLVHCQHGADRTGTMCAIYRIVVQGWTKQDAIEEMTKGGFNFHEIWTNLPDWIQEIDVEALRKEVGIKTPPKP